MISELFMPYVKGGVERRNWEIARRLARNHEVHVFTMRPPNTLAEEIIEGVSVHRTSCVDRLYDTKGRRRVRPALEFALGLFRRLGRERRRFDVVDCSAFPFFPCYPARSFSKRQGAPLIVTFHEVWGGYWREYFGNRVMAEAGRIVERSVARLPDLIVSVSRLTSKRLVNDLGVDPKRIVHVPNGVDLSVFDARACIKDPDMVLFVGRLVPSKRVDLAVRALARVREVYPRVKLHIVGDGPELSSLKSLVEGLGLSGNVSLLGTLPTYKEVADRMMRSRLFVMPSTREGFGMVVLESMAASTPVIVAKYEANAALELVDHEHTGFVVEPDSPDAIAEAIMRLLGDEELYRRLALNGRVLAESLTWDETASAMERVYSSSFPTQRGLKMLREE